jgi:DNA recombination protein RmuC
MIFLSIFLFIYNIIFTFVVVFLLRKCNFFQKEIKIKDDSISQKESQIIKNNAEIGFKNQEYQRIKLDFNELNTNLEYIRNKLKESEIERVKLQAKCEEVEINKRKFFEDTEKMNAFVMQKNQKTVIEESENKIVKPVKEMIESFKNQLNIDIKVEMESRVRLQEDLKNSILNIGNISQKIGQDANELSQALKTKSQMLGAWGEAQLERILEKSGLINGIDYIKQGDGMQIKSEDGNILRPDFTIKLPDEKHIVVDVKTSLINYVKYCNSENEEDKRNNLNIFIGDIKRHIEDLSGKDYHKVQSKGSKLDIVGDVLMFIPAEAVYNDLVRHNDGEIFKYAWSKNINIVGPYNIMPVLKTMHYFIAIEKQNRNALNIISNVEKMADKFSSVYGEVIKIDKAFNGIGGQFKSLIDSKIEGRGGLISLYNKIIEAGVIHKKKLSIDVDSDKQEIITDDGDEKNIKIINDDDLFFKVQS